VEEKERPRLAAILDNGERGNAVRVGGEARSRGKADGRSVEVNGKKEGSPGGERGVEKEKERN
jgi:hypothetical protein